MLFISLTFLKKKLIAASRLSKSSITNTLKPKASNFLCISNCILVGFLPVVFISAKPTYPPWQSIILSGKPFINVDNSFITHIFFVRLSVSLNVRSKSFSLIISFISQFVFKYHCSGEVPRFRVYCSRIDVPVIIAPIL